MSIFRKSVEKTHVPIKSDKKDGTSHEDQYTYMIIYLSVLPRMKKCSRQICGDNQNAFYFHALFFFENLAFYEILRKSMVQADRPQMKIRRMRISCWITKVTNRHAVYTECNRRNGPDFGRVFLMLNYTEKPQNTYIHS